MPALVADASKNAPTWGIAERIAERLAAAGHQAGARPVHAAGELGRLREMPLATARAAHQLGAARSGLRRRDRRRAAVVWPAIAADDCSVAAA